MFSFSVTPPRYFVMEHPLRPGEQLHLLPPLLETVRRMDQATTVADVTAIACVLLSRNQEGETITAAELGGNVDFDQLRRFIAAFRAWLADTKSSDPN